MSSSTFDIQEVQWEEVASDIKKHNRSLFDALEACSLSPQHTFVKACYPYGAKIIDNGILHLPHKTGASVPVSSADIDEKLKKKLSYSAIPLAFLANKASEVFVNKKERPIPLKLLSPGQLFGLFEIADLLSGIKGKPIWCVSSGARSLFMLPKIADKVGYQRIKKALQLEIDPPRSMMEHWQIFTSLTNHAAHVTHWKSEIIFFTDIWFENWQQNAKLFYFYNYIFKEITLQRHYTSSNIEFDLNWQNFTLAIGSRNLRPRPYLLDTAKSLFAISRGALPGFKPAQDNDIVAPIRLLQDIYVNIYELKNYLPTLMHPFNLVNGQKTQGPVYYSLSYPCVLEGLPSYKTNAGDIISDMRLLKKLFSTAQDFSHLPDMGVLPTGGLKHNSYEYFHSEIDIYQEIAGAHEIAVSDPAFLWDEKNFPNRDFCASSPFLSGCIRVSI